MRQVFDNGLADRLISVKVLLNLKTAFWLMLVMVTVADFVGGSGGDLVVVSFGVCYCYCCTYIDHIFFIFIL